VISGCCFGLGWIVAKLTPRRQPPGFAEKA
jgi:hypothetical protein